MDSKISIGISPFRNDPENPAQSEVSPKADSSQEEQKLRSELKRFLGPLTPSLLRDASGALDLSRIPAKSFDEFKAFLSAQAALNDSKSFRNPYQKMLESEDFRSLLGLLYQEKDPEHFVSISVEEGSRQLDELTAALIEIDVDAFVQRQLNSREGLGRLRHVFGKAETFTGNQRADVAKALGRARDHTEDRLYSFCIDQKISMWNFFNLGVTEEEVTQASELAVKLIEGLEDRLPAPASNSKFEALRGVEASQVEKFQKIQKEKSGEPNPVSQAQAALADLWLLTANQKLWSLQNQYGGYEDRAHALKQIELLFEASEKIQDEDGFRAFNEELQNFIEGPITTEGDDAAAWASYRILGIGMEQVYDNVDPVQRGPYQKIQRLSSEWKYATECGLTILIHLQTNASEDAAVRHGSNRLILNLKETQRQLWHGYKQHKAISRLGSDVAQIPYLIAKEVGAKNPADYALGDNAQIDAANQEIGRIIENLREANDPEELGQEIEKLHELLKPGSLLYTAYEAAEMNGTEQILGLAQTVAIITATAAATRGGSVVAGTGVGGAPPAPTASWLDKMVKGFAWGAYIATAENVVAAGTGEVREGGETAEKWIKDAVATGTATAMTGPWMKAGTGTAPEQGVVRNLFLRYTSNGLQGVKHLGGDVAMETSEEVADQILRHGLDGKTLAPSLAELEEITKITVAGGGTKIGALAQAMKPTSPLAQTVVSQTETKNFASPLTLQSPLLAPMWTLMGAGGIGGPGGKRNHKKIADKEVETIVNKILESDKGKSSPRRLEAVQKLLRNVDFKPEETLETYFEVIKIIGSSLEVQDRMTLLDNLEDAFLDHENDNFQELALDTFAELTATLPPFILKDYYEILESTVLFYQCTIPAANRALLAIFPRLDPAARLESAKELHGIWAIRSIEEGDWAPFQAAIKLHLSPEQLEELESSPFTHFHRGPKKSDQAVQQEFPSVSEIAKLTDKSTDERLTLLEHHFDNPDGGERGEAIGAFAKILIELPPEQRIEKLKILEDELVNNGFQDLPSVVAIFEVFPHLEPKARFELALRLKQTHAIFQEANMGGLLFEWMRPHLTPEQWLFLVQAKPSLDKDKLNAIGFPALATLALDPWLQDSATILSAGIAALLFGMALSPYRDSKASRPVLSTLEMVMFDSRTPLTERRVSALYQFLSAARADLEFDILEPGQKTFVHDLNKPLREAFLTTLRNLGLQEDAEFLELKGAKYWEPSLARWSSFLLPSAAPLAMGGLYLHSMTMILSSFLPIVLFGAAWGAASFRKHHLARQLPEKENPAFKLIKNLHSKRLPEAKSPEVRIQEFDITENETPVETKNKTEAEIEAEAELESTEESGDSIKPQNLLSLALATGGSGLVTLLSPEIAEAAVSLPIPADNSGLSIAGALVSAAASFGALGSIYLRLRYMYSSPQPDIRLGRTLPRF